MMAKKQKKEPAAQLWVRVICGILGFLMVFGVLMMLIPYSEQSMAYAAELPESALPSDQMISVGLHCQADAVSSFTAKSDTGFQISYRKSDTSSETLISSASGELTVAIDANLYRYGSGLVTENLGVAAVGGYHIQISYFSFANLGIDTDRDNPVFIKPSTPTNITDGYSRENVQDYIELLSANTAIQHLEQPVFPYFSATKTYIRIGSFYTEAEAQAALVQLEKSMNLRAEVISPQSSTLTVLDSATWMPVCELSTEQYDLLLAPAVGTIFTDPAGRVYRGSLLLKRTDKTSGELLQVVNRLPLEEYVAALLPYEVSASENEELLKTMAIVLRTEAVLHMGAHSKDGYDVCSSSHCHIFNGSLADTDAIRQAVLETAGKVLTYQNQPIYTPYTVVSGGSTLSSAEAFGKSLAYLPSLFTPWEDTNSAVSGQGSWSIELSPYELYLLLNEMGYDQIKGNIDSVQILKIAENSNYVTEIVFTDLFGNSVLLTGSETIRSLLTGFLPSASFVVGKAGESVEVTERKLTGEGLSYTEEVKTVTLDGTYGSFVFIGEGIGCGVGLSIAGARALCDLGYTCEQILNIYYPDTQIG